MKRGVKLIIKELLNHVLELKVNKNIKLCKILFESVSDSDVFQMYHGGMRMEVVPDSIRGARQGKYESGIGINFTNSFETAKKYAGGSRVVHLVDIDKNIVTLEDTFIDMEEAIDFIKGLKRLKHREKIIDGIRQTKYRKDPSNIYASVLNNLFINYEAGAGKVGLDLVNFFLSKGIDGTFTDKSGNEVWFVLFNLQKIKRIQIMKGYPKTVEEWMLPNPQRS